MGLFTLEHGKGAYRADFVLYGAAVLALAAFLVLDAPRAHGLGIVLWTATGLAGWSLTEYALHRFVLHGVQPFQGWHAAHHARPTALICAPTVLSAALIVMLVFLPALLLGDVWLACALTLGLVAGYLAYAITHHATHHWRADSAWLRGRKRWHALHHHSRQPGCYGVTSGVWDHVFGSARRAARRAVLTPP
jgi:sterol desaturase/sphingolipid hydroxylase (fatty acid hydroxylase superfamily)